MLYDELIERRTTGAHELRLQPRCLRRVLIYSNQR